MLTDPEQTLLTWLREFQRTGPNQLTLARKDIAVIVNAFARLDAPLPAPVPVAIKAPTPIEHKRSCVDCHDAFTTANVPRAMLVGRGPLCKFCAERRGLL